MLLETESACPAACLFEMLSETKTGQQSRPLSFVDTDLWGWGGGGGEGQIGYGVLGGGRIGVCGVWEGNWVWV